MVDFQVVAMEGDVLEAQLLMENTQSAPSDDCNIIIIVDTIIV